MHALVNQGMIFKEGVIPQVTNLYDNAPLLRTIDVLLNCLLLTVLNMLNVDNAFESGFNLGVGMENRNHLEEMCSVNKVDGAG